MNNFLYTIRFFIIMYVIFKNVLYTDIDVIITSNGKSVFRNNMYFQYKLVSLSFRLCNLFARGKISKKNQFHKNNYILIKNIKIFL